MRKLSTKTIKSYSCEQLAKHLDRLMSKFDIAPYRVDFAYGKIYEFSKSDSSYHHLCSINDYNKESVVDCIDSAWWNLEHQITEKLDQLHHELAQQSPERIQALCDDELSQDGDNPSIEPKVDSQIEP